MCFCWSGVMSGVFLWCVLWVVGGCVTMGFVHEGEHWKRVFLLLVLLFPHCCGALFMEFLFYAYPSS